MTTAFHSTSAPTVSGQKTTSRPTSGAVVHVVTNSEGGDDHPVRHNKGRFVERGGRIVWRKEPRFRGSGTLAVLDDPVRDGRALARTGDRLPSDRDRDRDHDRWPGGQGLVMMRKEEGWWRSGEEGTLRYEEGERDGEFTIGEIVRLRMEKPAYTVRIVRNRQRRRKDEGKGIVPLESARESHKVKFEVGIQQPAEAVAVDESAVYRQEVEVGSYSTSESSQEDRNPLPDFSCEEADGWVPVMVAEDDEGDDWMSLTGSWVWMGEGGETKNC
ncbi:hypothetical protein C8A03DRAFT_38083 [Achaetomium macrosporum]|uniref:Uncharacterized protein n=1 Tax=Achaetomium macrosporum TaxID=79813 RepID=A0AAN7C2G8_9PEZI|nr:hypothetical protein C8A03DRAFT_38083 [Achaetomium macrosporum]